MQHISQTQLVISCAGIALTVLMGAAATIQSYGRLEERVAGMDDRLARIENAIYSRPLSKP